VCSPWLKQTKYTEINQIFNFCELFNRTYNTQKCGNCLYFKYIECHKTPPVIFAWIKCEDGIMDGAYPQADEREWCGEWTLANPIK